MKVTSSSPILDHCFLPVGLVLSILICLLWNGGDSVARNASLLPLNDCLALTFFFISGILLRIDHLFDQGLPLNSFLPVATVQFFVAPLCVLFSGLLLPLPEAGFIGLAAISCVPSSFSCATRWTIHAEGNEILALSLTLLLTLTGTLLSPILFGILLRTGVSIDLSITTLILKLCFLVLLPLILGHLLRRSLLPRPPACFRHLPPLCLVLMIWLLSQGNAATLRELPWYAWPGFIALCLSLHLIWFGIIWIYAEKRGIHHRNQTAMAMSGSQKTLALTVTILAVSLGAGPLANLLPVATLLCSLFYLVQILADSFMVTYLIKPESTYA